MLEVAKEKMYFGEEHPKLLYFERDEDSPVNESMIGTTQLIDNDWYHIKGVSYKVTGDHFTKIIIVE